MCLQAGFVYIVAFLLNVVVEVVKVVAPRGGGWGKKENRERALGPPLAPNGREKKLCSAPFPSRPPPASRDSLASAETETQTHPGHYQLSKLLTLNSRATPRLGINVLIRIKEQIN